MKNLCYLLIFILYACHTPYKEQEQNNAPTEHTKKLQAQMFHPNEIFDVMQIGIVNDNLIIASAKSDTLIHVYDTKTLQIRSAFGKKGDGPNDIMLPILCNTNTDTLFLGGFDRLTTFKSYIFNGEDFVSHQIYKVPQHGNPMNDITYVGSNQLIYNDIFELKINSINLLNNEKKHLKEFKKDNHSESFFYSNKGTLAVSKNGMAYAYMYKDQIDFMDSKGNTIKIIKGSSNPHIAITQKADNKTFYINIVATKDRYYALYRNKTRNEYKVGNYKGDLMKVYDKDGTLLTTYSFDSSPILYAVDQNNKKMIGFNSLQEKEVLLIYDLL